MSCLYTFTCVTLEFVVCCGGESTLSSLWPAVLCVFALFSHLAFVSLSLTIVWNVHALDNTDTNPTVMF